MRTEISKNAGPPKAMPDPAPLAPGLTSDRTLSLDVDPRKPRLAWQGNDGQLRAVAEFIEVVA